MSQNSDSFLNYLDRYEENLDNTGDKIKHKLCLLVDKKIQSLKDDVTLLRKRILRGQASIRDLANDPVSSGKTVDFKEYHATRARNQDNAASALDDSVPTSPTTRKRTRKNQQQSVAKRQKTNSGADNQEDGESNVTGLFKINIIHLNCSVEGCEMTFQTKVDLRKHLKAVHKIAPYQCNIKDCGERFWDKYTVFNLDCFAFY